MFEMKAFSKTGHHTEKYTYNFDQPIEDSTKKNNPTGDN